MCKGDLRKVKPLSEEAESLEEASRWVLSARVIKLAG